MTKRSLMLAGGGMKVAFQAGVLQVWLDEAGLHFDHIDGASGGCFNAAMRCQGMSGTRIADNWRHLRPVEGVAVNWSLIVEGPLARSVFTLDAYREKVFPAWGYDWEQVRRSGLEATFNVYNFSRQQLEVWAPSDMTEDRLCACVSLPMWFPPVRVDGDTYIDPVFVTDCNLEEAIRRGADEIWVIWTVGQTGEWNDGFVNNYFQIIEAAANGRFKLVCDRIEKNNQAILGGGFAEFGRFITLKILRAEVELNYIVNLGADKVAEAVERGVEVARAWCAENRIPLGPAAAAAPAAGSSEPATSLQFSEVMKGFVQPGEVDCAAGAKAAEAAGHAASVQLTIRTNDVDRFIIDPHHEAAIEGIVNCGPWGRDLRVGRGVFNLLVDSDRPQRKYFDYRVYFNGSDGRPLTLIGHKDIQAGDASDLWTDTTTLFTRILDGHVEAEDDPAATILGAGILRIHPLDFLHQLTTFRAAGPTRASEAKAIVRFGTLFLGKLWDVYARRVLPASPF